MHSRAIWSRTPGFAKRSSTERMYPSRECPGISVSVGSASSWSSSSRKQRTSGTLHRLVDEPDPLERAEVGHARVPGVEEAQLVQLPVVDPVGDEHAGVLPRRAAGGELVLHDPLAERLRHDRPAVLDAAAGAQPLAVALLRDRRDPVDHRVRERARILDPRGEPVADAGGRGHGGGARGVAVAGQVVAAEDRERPEPAVQRAGRPAARRSNVGAGSAASCAGVGSA